MCCSHLILPGIILVSRPGFHWCRLAINLSSEPDLDKVPWSDLLPLSYYSLKHLHGTWKMPSKRSYKQEKSMVVWTLEEVYRHDDENKRFQSSIEMVNSWGHYQSSLDIPLWRSKWLYKIRILNFVIFSWQVLILFCQENN